MSIKFLDSSGWLKQKALSRNQHKYERKQSFIPERDKFNQSCRSIKSDSLKIYCLALVYLRNGHTNRLDLFWKNSISCSPPGVSTSHDTPQSLKTIVGHVESSDLYQIQRGAALPHFLTIFHVLFWQVVTRNFLFCLLQPSGKCLNSTLMHKQLNNNSFLHI